MALLRARCVLITSLLAMVSCVSGAPIEPRAQGPSHVNQDIWRATISGDVVGRVKLAGQAIPYFGVTVTEQVNSNLGPPVPVRNVDGKFAVKIPPGTWDVVVSGPGFARHVSRHIVVTSAYVNAPLEISVNSGYAIEGTVTDIDGVPVRGAIVKLRQGPETSTGDPLWELSRGNFTIVTDTMGDFRFVGMSMIGRNATVSASLLPGRASMPKLITDGEVNITLQLLPLGSIEGTVTGPAQRAQQARLPKYMIVIRSVTTGGTFGSQLENRGTFRLADVPEGEYDVGLLETSGPSGTMYSKRVHVLSGKVADVTLTAPP